MKPQGIVGIILIVVGIIALALGGFSFTTNERVVKAGPLEVNAQKEHSVPISPVVGIVCIVAGGALVATGRK